MKAITKHFAKKTKGLHSSQSAFALPTVVLTATILMIAAVSVAQTVVTISTAVRAQNWQNLADEAVQAGISYATSCLRQNTISYWSSSLTPNTSCSGTSGSGGNYIEQNSQYTSTFSVAPPDTSGSKPEATVTGTVTLAGTTKQYISKGVAIVNLASNPTTTTLPTSPVDGQEVYYRVNRGDGTYAYWHLRYNASTTYWDFLGGPSMFAQVDATQTTTSTTFTNLATVGPSLTVPLAGDYDVTIGARLYGTTNSMASQMGYSINGGGVGYIIDSYSGASYDGGATVATHEVRTVRQTGITANASFVAKYRVFPTTNVPGYFGYRTMQISPVRVK